MCNPIPRLLFLVLLMLGQTIAVAAESATSSQDTSFGPAYRIQPGDILAISVWREEQLDRIVLVRPDGGISFPLAGDVMAAGKTIVGLRDELKSLISEYISEPVVMVAINEARGNKVYIIGKVTRPGVFPMTSYIDVMQALSMAGGLTPFAQANDIKILRRAGSSENAIPFRYADVENGKRLDQNIILQSGDVVVVP